jgi:hypothetical protein
MTDKIVIEAINKTLADRYKVFDGRPMFRLVWSEDQLEVRKGTFTDWYGQIMIRQEHMCVREVKKYWYFQAPCWVLEKLIFMHSQSALDDLCLELVTARNGTYEPLYPFWHDGKKIHLPVVHDVVEYIIHAVHNPQKMTESDHRAIMEKEEKSEVEYFEAELENDARSDLFVFENSSFVSLNQKRFREGRFKKNYDELAKPIEGASNVTGPVISLV